MLRRLRLSRIKGAESDIIGSRLPGLHGEMAAIVTGDPDLRVGAEQGPRLPNVAVLLSEMNAVGTEPSGQRDAVVDDEGDPGVRADALQWLCQSGDLVLGPVLHPQLEGGNGLDSSDGRQPIREISTDLLRRDQVQPARLRPPRRRELGRIEILVQG